MIGRKSDERTLASARRKQLEERTAELEKAQVPRAMHGGVSCILSAFNHERWMICAVALVQMRLVLAEAFKFASAELETSNFTRSNFTP